ncbi:MAG: hypothetical protein VKJ24_22070 [Synechococcales bacterium]|nr:hypothetical protein [Synechococcales bacterium]
MKIGQCAEILDWEARKGDRILDFGFWIERRKGDRILDFGFWIGERRVRAIVPSLRNADYLTKCGITLLPTIGDPIGAI